MIRLFVGNVGSGKTISIIKEMAENKDNKYYPITFSNIKTKGLNNIVITRDMLIKKEVTGTKRNGEETYKLKFNKEFWEEQREKYNGFNVVIDEAHTLFNSRRSMSKQNVIMGDFLALIRKLAQDSVGKCHLTMISQLVKRIDNIAREMANQIRHHVCVYDKVCNNCGSRLLEHNEMPEPSPQCWECGSYDLRKENHRLIVWFFQNIEDYFDWLEMGEKRYYKLIKIQNIEMFFDLYDTLQIDNLISED